MVLFAYVLSLFVRVYFVRLFACDFINIVLYAVDLLKFNYYFIIIMWLFSLCCVCP
jgi:hypothetical protein